MLHPVNVDRLNLKQTALLSRLPSKIVEILAGLVHFNWKRCNNWIKSYYMNATVYLVYLSNYL